MKFRLQTHPFGVEELNADEVKSIDGGYWFLVGLAVYLYDSRDKFLAGVNAGIKDFQ